MQDDGQDKFQEECAIVGVIGDPEAANYCYLGLYAMQHRGQEGCGIVASDGESVYAHRDMGLVSDVFDSAKPYQGRGSGVGDQYCLRGDDGVFLEATVSDFRVCL